MTSYGYARNAKGKIEQVLVTRENGRQVSQTFTGVLYRNIAEADRDMVRLNCS